MRCKSYRPLRTLQRRSFRMVRGARARWLSIVCGPVATLVVACGGTDSAVFTAGPPGVDAGHGGASSNGGTGTSGDGGGTGLSGGSNGGGANNGGAGGGGAGNGGTSG